MKGTACVILVVDLRTLHPQAKGHKQREINGHIDTRRMLAGLQYHGGIGAQLFTLRRKDAHTHREINGHIYTHTHTHTHTLQHAADLRKTSEANTSFREILDRPCTPQPLPQIATASVGCWPDFNITVASERNSSPSGERTRTHKQRER